MISARDLIRVLRFPLQEVSDWISLARPSHLHYGAVAEVSLYLAGVPARPPTPLFTRVRRREILRTSPSRISRKLPTLGLAGHLRLGGFVWAQQFLKALHRRDLRLRLLPEGQTLQYLVELFLRLCVHQEHDGRTTDRVSPGHHFALRLQLRQGLHRREDRTPYELGQLIYGKQRVGSGQVHFHQVQSHPKADDSTGLGCRGSGHNRALRLALIHRSAWNRNSRKL